MSTLGEVVEKLRRSTVQVRARRNGSGSGVIWSQDGQIVTNAHVLGNSSSVEVELWDARRVPGKIVKTDRRRDLALLQLEASGLPAATAGDSNALRPGELVVAVGNPFGFTGAASSGVIHRLDSSWIVSQVRLAPGNSGGPLANVRGDIIGINTMIAGGLAFAIPSRAVTGFLSTSPQVRTELGVVVRPLDTGFLVLEVVRDSPAHYASLLIGDILTGAGGNRFSSLRDLENAIQASPKGVLELQFRRGRAENIRTVAVRLSAAVRAA